MENKIPIPTDNIFKFYALFGLLLFVFSAGSIIYVVHTTNELAFQAALEVTALKQIPNPTAVETAKIQILEKRLGIASADKDFYLLSIQAMFIGSLVLMFYGFFKWHNDIQPLQDEVAKLQLEKLRYEVKLLKNSKPSK